MQNKAKVAVLISGRGGNLRALLEATKDKTFPVEICLVISNKADAYGLKHAEEFNIPSFVIDHKGFSNRQEFDDKIDKKLEEYNIDIVCLAGFMRLLTANFTEKWQGRIINIHPSLLPSFKGANAIEQAFKAGVKITGCTVHYVTAQMDEGPIIVQESVRIDQNDNLETLSSKIAKKEHIAYVQALRIVANKFLLQ